MYHLPPLVDSRCRPRNRLVTITKQNMQSFKACSSRMHEKGLDLERAVKKPIENPGCLSVSEDPEYWRHTVLIQISMNHFWNHPLKYFLYSIDFRHTCRCPRELNILAFTLKLCSHFHLHSSEATVSTLVALIATQIRTNTANAPSKATLNPI